MSLRDYLFTVCKVVSSSVSFIPSDVTRVFSSFDTSFSLKFTVTFWLFLAPFSHIDSLASTTRPSRVVFFVTENTVSRFPVCVFTRFSSFVINGPCYDLHVFGIKAQRIKAQMIYGQSFRYFAFINHICAAMRHCALLNAFRIEPSHRGTITSLVGSWPRPTSIRTKSLRQFLESFFKSHITHVDKLTAFVNIVNT